MSGEDKRSNPWTSGPYFISRRVGGPWILAPEVGCSGGPGLVAVCETEEDARLLASSPELVEVLENLVNISEPFLQSSDSKEPGQATLEEANKVLRKAYGEE